MSSVSSMLLVLCSCWFYGVLQLATVSSVEGRELFLGLVAPGSGGGNAAALVSLYTARVVTALPRSNDILPIADLHPNISVCKPLSGCCLWPCFRVGLHVASAVVYFRC